MVPKREADLYAPLKAYLVQQGYDVKAEIGDCDIMARRGDEPPVVVEMKLTFSLQLVMQGVARQGMFDHVYLAVPVSKGWKLRYRDIITLCRRLSLGLLAVGPKGIEAHLDPAPYAPRIKTKAAARLLREFDRRVGDPNEGGITGVKKMTAYRQDAIRCARHLQAGPCKAAVVAKVTGVTRAGDLMRRDHYGWFERVSLGIYSLTPKGHAALTEYAGLLAPAEDAP
ncbi:DUF2161 domain-containing phosphodiesterase [Pseudorhodobacter aquimaris]|uniref:DUF2161 domain-containing phosphodiesterase n=1 Tax=Pseudorhodobacter aquimaris TaxID=687412 RepID=UPI00067B98DF|nr:DUF2161 family putative PD-(D/E)XK-type phosphodiesterase [Pseudorhodobacter aquimaris]